MPQPSNKLSQFWQELKRRNVTRVLAVYIAAAFMILELITMISEPFGLPEGSLKVAFIISLAGLVIAVIVSWVYDIHPEGGLVKTEPAQKVNTEDLPKSSYSWKLASYISFVVIVGLIGLNIFGNRNQIKIDESFAKSLAVLPFHNYTGDSNQDFICLGLTDEIISHLYKIESFDEVRSLTSVLAYKDSDLSTTEIAEELNVNYILEGSYKRMGDEIRITAQLIEPNNDKHIWLQDYDLPYKKIIGIPANIALQIANHLKAYLTNSETHNIQKISTTNITAYEFYLRGIDSYYLHTDFEKSAGYFEEAIQFDSTYALAYSYLAQCYQFIARYSLSSFSSNENAHSKAKGAAQKAYELDPLLGEALAVFGLILAEDWEIYAPEELFNRAVKLSPGSPEVYSSFAQYLRWLGRYDESISFAQKALELDPLNHMSYQWLAVFYSYAGHFDKSNQQLEKVLELKPDFMHAHGLYAINYLLMGEYDRALDYANMTMSTALISDIPILLLSPMTMIYAKAGFDNKAHALLEEMLELSHNQFVDPVYLAGAYSGLGENEIAMSYLAKAFELRSGQMIYLRAYGDWIFKDLSSDPRYTDLLEKIGFKE